MVYNAGGQAQTETHPGGKTISRTFNGLGLPESTLPVLVDGVVAITFTDTTFTGTTYRRVGVVSNGAEADNFYTQRAQAGSSGRGYTAASLRVARTVAGI